jgi:multidrug efflux system membrane fusion protein
MHAIRTSFKLHRKTADQESHLSLIRGQLNRTPIGLRVPGGMALTSVSCQFWIGAMAMIVATFLCGCQRPSATAAMTAPPPVAVTTAKPVEREIVTYAEFTGNTAAVNSVDIRARVSGYLDKIGFAEGAIVKTGDMLFVIDPRPYQAALDLAQANVDQAQAQLQLAQSNYSRAEDLQKRGVISPQDFETQSATRAQANASLLANQASLETAKLNLEFTQVRSPIDGRTSIYNYTLGNLISGGDTTSSGILTTVVSLDPMYVYFNVEERGLLAYQEMIRTGKVLYTEGGKAPVEMQLANETGYPHQGFVDFVDNKVDPATGTIRVRGAFANKDGFLRPGLFAQVRIPSSPKFKALLISDLAVGYDQGQPIVYVVGADDIAKSTQVKLGALSEGLRVVESGLTADDRVVVDGIVHLRPGSKVVPQEGTMTDFAGGLRKQVAVAPAESKPKPDTQAASSPGKSQ